MTLTHLVGVDGWDIIAAKEKTLCAGLGNRKWLAELQIPYMDSVAHGLAHFHIDHGWIARMARRRGRAADIAAPAAHKSSHAPH